ncbi:hypothetical protein PB1_09742 [Bacillus methanolicus PB1]|uniref:Uncharacterized protein n=1 Tax=Bacillus methanolicus PB1 TaxID=997296 RepID=I3E2B2_BACMT|nr:hypothetical protein PB1_09742 [Bacillus methanolicus PB1]
MKFGSFHIGSFFFIISKETFESKLAGSNVKGQTPPIFGLQSFII